MIRNIMYIENKYGDTPDSIANELAGALYTRDSFVLFCYWAEFLNDYYLDDLNEALDMYLHNDEWKEFCMQVQAKL